MKRLIFVPFILSFNVIASAQVTLDTIESYWRMQNYNQVLNLSNSYYTINKKRILKIDLMKVSSMCRLGKDPLVIKQCIDYISHAYRLPKDLALDCETTSHNFTNDYFRTDTKGPSIFRTWQQPYTKGKPGHPEIRFTLYRKVKVLVKEDKPIIEKNYSIEDLQNRKLFLNTKINIDSFYTRLYDSLNLSNLKFKIINNFIVIYSQLDLSSLGIDNVQTRLKNYYQFYIDSLGMEPMKEFTTIFLAKDKIEMDEFAQKLHGFKPSSNNLGYASTEDNMIISIAYYPGKPLLGTVCHELIHILVNETFGVLPPWLEEGIASLYEVSELAGNTILGKPNWREKIFCDAWVKNYYTNIVETMMKLDWAEFNEPDYYENQKFVPVQSLNYALSRFFMIYLQEKKILIPFFKEAGLYSSIHIRKGHINDYIEIAQKYSKMNYDNLIKDFEDWLKENCNK